VAARRASGAVELVVEDDGQGFDVDTRLREADEGGHVGILGMRERVEAVRGRMELRSNPGEGTRLTVTIPVQEQEPCG